MRISYSLPSRKVLRFRFPEKRGLQGHMQRREFVSLVGSAAAWPLAARAQQRDRIRQIGVLSPFSENDPETKTRLTAFKERLEQLGWTDGRNVRIEYRFSEGNIERTRAAAAELVALGPDVIVAYANPAVSALKPITSTIPIVFTQVSDPVGSGSSRTSRILVATLLDSTVSNLRSVGNGWRRSSRSPLQCVARQSSTIRE